MDKPYTCSECKQPCDAKWEDCGIGSYEYWGQKCNQTDYQFLSDCCGAPTVEDPPDDDGRADYEYERRKEAQLENKEEFFPAAAREIFPDADA